MFISGRQTNVGHPHPSPTAGNGDEDLRQLFDKRSLLLQCEHKVAVTLTGRSERGKDSSAHAKIWLAHVRTFFGAFEAEGDAAEIVDGHWHIELLCQNALQIIQS